MPSDTAFGADNQQERLLNASWIVGFVDGEGCFSVSCIKNQTTRFGIQLFPEFVVTQGAKSHFVLEELQRFFRCGKVFINNRRDNHREPIYRYCVRSLDDLVAKIIPFFEKNPLRTDKRNDFRIFRSIVLAMKDRQHSSESGLRTLMIQTATMNRKQKRREL